MSDDERTYHVVINHEEQYSIWPIDQDVPDGWRTEGTTGPKAACLAHIDEVWTDMRPLSLRRYMEDHPDGEQVEVEQADPGPSLVERLCAGMHPVEVSLRPERTVSALRDAIDRGYVFIRFTSTRGGTELGVELDRERSEIGAADLAGGTGRLRLFGRLELDFEPVTCVADIDVAALSGTGRLERRAAG
jgi:uncharacterized protein YbdZ (MbtH family)